MSERWVDELLPDQPQWVRDLVDDELRKREARLAEAEALLREIREDASHFGMPTTRIDAFLAPDSASACQHFNRSITGDVWTCDFCGKRFPMDPEFGANTPADKSSPT